MLFTDNTRERKSLSKTLFSGTAISALSAMLAVALAPAAQAQVNPGLGTLTIDDCSEFADSPSTGDDGLFITIDIADECVVASGDHIDFGSGPEGQDNVIVIVESGTTLTNTDTSGNDNVFFTDNGENRIDFLIEDGAVLNGANGVIYIEGDESLIVNRGDLIGTGTADEGVIYIDRDTDGALNTIVNEGTGSIIAQQGGPAIGIEVLLADSFDDAEDLMVQQALEDFPNIRIVNRAGGLIQTTGREGVSDDDDGINIAGNPGDTGGFARECIEGAAVNCQLTLRVINEGTIASIQDNSGNAGITFEDDAVFNGAIINRGAGVITGTRNGIRIGDIELDGSTAEHTGSVINSASITGTGAGSRGIDLEGDGITILNRASGTISGLTTGIEVGSGSSSGVEHSGVNNTIQNSGTISGGSFSIDSTNAEGAVEITSIGGTFTGDIRGSVANVDALNIRSRTTDLTHDILQNFNVRVVNGGQLNFIGDRTIDGRLLVHGGTASFDLGDTQTVTGDVVLTRSSTVEISDTSGVAGIGDEFTLISVGGTLDNNASLDATQAVADSSFLLDFEFVDSNDLVVGAIAAGEGSASAKVSAFSNDIQFATASAKTFGESVLTGFVDGGLNNTAAFSNLGDLGTAADVGTAISSLAPDFSGNLVRNVFNTVQSGTAQIDQRLNDLNCNAFDGEQNCQSFAESGAWAQVSSPHSTQGSLSLTGSAFFNNGSDQDNVTMTYGYDQAVGESTIVGFSGSYTESELNDDTQAVSSTELDVLQFNAYAGHRIGNAHLVTKASYSHGEADTRRQSFDVIRSEVDINGLNFQGLASYDVNLGQGYYLKPEAGFHYNNVTTSAFTETGGLNLDVSASKSNVLDSRVGLTLGARKLLAGATQADVYVTGAVRNDLFGERGDIGYNFAGQSGSLAVLNEDQFAVQALAGVNVLSGENFSFGAALNSEFSDTENAVGGSLQTKVRW